MTENTKRPMAGVNRAGLADAALELVQEDGLDALTMRTLADRTGVKAASLYWHVRDRDELLELMADALLARVRLPAERCRSASAVARHCAPQRARRSPRSATGTGFSSECRTRCAGARCTRAW